MIDHYNINEKMMNSILEKKYNMEKSLEYKSFKIILFQPPEGAKRHRYRIIGKSNYMQEAKVNPFVHVYSPNAANDSRYMRRLLDTELDYLNIFVQTTCICHIQSFIKTPSNYSISDIFLAELGYHKPNNKPDWDNIGKKYSDMFNLNVWLDDTLVTTGIVDKFYSILPRIEITINYLNYITHPYQYKSIIKRTDYNNQFPISHLDRYGNPI